jgi:type VII secretion integral membrane protein EccD
VTTTIPAVPAAPTTGPDVCRLTIAGPGGRADLAVPVAATLSELLAALVRHAPGLPGTADPCVLQRLGGTALDSAETVHGAGLRHGDLLYLRPAAEPLPALAFDDVADGVAEVVAGGKDRWTPALTRAARTAITAAVLAALFLGILLDGRGRSPSLTAALLAVALACTCAPAWRPDTGALRTVTASAAIAFAALAGLTLLRATPAGFAPSHRDILLAAACTGTISLALLVTRWLPAALPGTALALAAVTAAAAGLDGLLGGRDPAGGPATVAVAALVLSHWVPRAALSAFGLRVPALPHDAEELQRGLEPELEERLVSAVGAAQACLTAAACATSALVAAAAAFLVGQPGAWPSLLAALLGCAALLRGWHRQPAWHRFPNLLAGAAALVLAVSVAGRQWLGAMPAEGALGAAAAALLVWARRPAWARPLPAWGRLAEIAEFTVPVAMVLLLGQVLNVYATLRANA